MNRYDSLSKGEYASQISLEFNETLASRATGKALDDAWDTWLTATETAQIAEDLTEAWSLPISTREMITTL